jgi:hypothetical protein
MVLSSRVTPFRKNPEKVRESCSGSGPDEMEGRSWRDARSSTVSKPQELIMKTMTKTLLISAACTAVGIVASHQPIVQKAFGRQARNVSSWTKNAKEGELDRFQLQLEQNLVQFTETRTRLLTEQQQVETKDADRREELARVEHLLACFKSAWGDGQRTAFPVTVFTRSYTKAEIEATVQQLLNRRTELESLQNNSAATLQQAMAQVDLRLAETRRHLDNMPVYTALAVTSDAVGRSDMVAGSLESCLAANQAFLTSPRKSASASAIAADSSGPAVSVADFLAPAAEPRQPEPARETPPTVSELTDALRNLVMERRTNN